MSLVTFTVYFQSAKLVVLNYRGVFRTLSNIHDGAFCYTHGSEYAFVLCSIITFQFYPKDLKLIPWQLRLRFHVQLSSLLRPRGSNTDVIISGVVCVFKRLTEVLTVNSASVKIELVGKQCLHCLLSMSPSGKKFKEANRITHIKKKLTWQWLLQS